MRLFLINVHSVCFDLIHHALELKEIYMGYRVYGDKGNIY